MSRRSAAVLCGYFLGVGVPELLRAINGQIAATAFACILALGALLALQYWSES